MDSNLSPLERLDIAIIKLQIDKKKMKKEMKEYEGKATLSNLLNGRKEISPDDALLFEKYYKISAVWIIFGRGEMMLSEEINHILPANMTVMSAEEHEALANEEKLQTKRILNSMEKILKEQTNILSQLKKD